MLFRALAGVPGLLRRVVAGVLDLRGRPLRLGVVPFKAPPSSSLRPRSGTFVVTVDSRRGVNRRCFGVGDWNRRRVVLRGPSPSASTVTNNRCGVLSSPTSSSKVCFLGDGGAKAVIRRSAAWVFFLMAEGGIMGGLRTGSMSGSGDDPRSRVMVRSSSIAADPLAAGQEQLACTRCRTQHCAAPIPRVRASVSITGWWRRC